jgi:hypothetical protein
LILRWLLLDRRVEVRQLPGMCGHFGPVQQAGSSFGKWPDLQKLPGKKRNGVRSPPDWIAGSLGQNILPTRP